MKHHATNLVNRAFEWRGECHHVISSRTTAEGEVFVVSSENEDLELTESRLRAMMREAEEESESPCGGDWESL